VKNTSGVGEVGDLPSLRVRHETWHAPNSGGHPGIARAGHKETERPGDLVDFSLRSTQSQHSLSFRVPKSAQLAFVIFGKNCGRLLPMPVQIKRLSLGRPSPVVEDCQDFHSGSLPKQRPPEPALASEGRGGQLKTIEETSF